MKKFFKKKGNRFDPKFIYLALVFVLAIALSSSATFSYAKFKIQKIVDRPANIALPVVDFEKIELIRNRDKAEEFVYSVEEDNIVLTDIEALDVIEYTFSINNFIEERGKSQLNEVLMEVELYFKVFLKRFATTQTQAEQEEGISYFVIQTDYEVESTPDATNMKGASIDFLRRNASNRYVTVNKLNTVKNGHDADALNAYNEASEVGVFVDYETRMHYYRFFFIPGQSETRNTFRLNIVLPQQVVDASTTIAGRLYIEMGYKAEQRQLKN